MARAGLGHNQRRAGPIFAISFDLDTDTLSKVYHNESWRNAYTDIANFLDGHGFSRQQGSVYFGNDTVDSVTCQTVVQRMVLAFDWFAPSVRDIRMLRIEDNNDLSPAIELALDAKRMAS